LEMIEAGAAHQQPDPGLLQRFESGQNFGAGHGQLDPVIQQDHAPQLRTHLFEGGDKTGDEAASQKIIAPPQGVAAHENKSFARGLLRFFHKNLTDAGVPPGPGDGEVIPFTFYLDGKPGPLQKPADVFLGGRIVHQHRKLLHVALVGNFFGFNHRVNTADDNDLGDIELFGQDCEEEDEWEI